MMTTTPKSLASPKKSNKIYTPPPVNVSDPEDPSGLTRSLLHLAKPISAYQKISKKISINHKAITVDYKVSFTANPEYSAFKVYCFLFLHYWSGFYFGYSMTSMNNLGKPILRAGMGYYGDDEIAKWLGNINLFYGIGKMIGSFPSRDNHETYGKAKCLVHC